MEYLINPGGGDDRKSIDLATSKGTRIRNWQRREQPTDALRDAVRFATEGHEGRVLRSLTSRYNCIGMAFANRRTCIEPTEVPMILKEDEYVEVPKAADVMPGDLVLYEDGDGISHVAVVVSNEPRLQDGDSTIRVISQWGSDGEYMHEYRDVPLLLGRPVRFYSERRTL
jgi:hypothetical protein